jgi:hypothetical protein
VGGQRRERPDEYQRDARQDIRRESDPILAHATYICVWRVDWIFARAAK